MARLSAWLTAAVDQRVALLRESGALSALQEAKLIVTTLKDPPADTQEALVKWERTCDCCGKDCADSAFYTGHISRDVGLFQVVITYGVCSTCKEGLDGP